MKKKHCLLFLLLLMANVVVAQKRVITGTVSSQDGKQPLQSINILANDQKGGTTTDKDGHYSIPINKATTTLIFSYVGYSSQSVTIGTSNTCLLYTSRCV